MKITKTSVEVALTSFFARWVCFVVAMQKRLSLCPSSLEKEKETRAKATFCSFYL
jgi:hypothetical protein